MDAVLSNPNVRKSPLVIDLILKNIFGYLDLKSLKACREGKGEELLSDLEYSCVSCGDNYTLVELPDSETLKFLNEIKGDVKNLNIVRYKMDDVQELEDCRNVILPQLLSLKMDWSGEAPRNEWSDIIAVEKNALKVSHVINGAKNLQKLEIHLGNPRLRPEAQIFLQILFRSVGLIRNGDFKRTLSSLSLNMNGDSFPYNREIESIRAMNFNLRYLELSHIYVRDTINQNEPLNALSMLVKDLSQSLETLIIFSSWRYKWPIQFEFLTEMSKLTTFHMQTSVYQPVQNIITLLKQLPKLQTFQLSYVRTTGIKLKDFERLDEVWPTLKEFKISSRTVCDELVDCPIYKYIPKIFPNLNILRFPIYSKNDLYSCIHYLKDQDIEELYLWVNEDEDETTELVEKQGKDKKPSEASGSKIPSLNAWKKLRKLTLNTETIDVQLNCSLYGLSLNEILPKSLTSLEIKDYGKYEADWLINLLQGLPSLMEFKVEGRVVDDRGKPINPSLLIDRIKKDPQIHPNLWINVKQ